MGGGEVSDIRCTLCGATPSGEWPWHHDCGSDTEHEQETVAAIVRAVRRGNYRELGDALQAFQEEAIQAALEQAGVNP